MPGTLTSTLSSSSAKNELSSHIENSSGEYVSALQQLCRQPSVSAQNRGLNECARLVHDLLDKVGFDVELVQLKDGPPVVYAQHTSQSSKETILLYNHYDVQPVEPVDLWKNPPFSAVIENGRVFARGAADNKANIVSRIMAITALLETSHDIPCNIKWVIEGEEEIGSPHFPEFISRYKHRLNADGGIWEFGGLDYRERPLVTLGVKGMLYVEFKSKVASKDTHSSRAAVVENPAWRLVKLLNSIRDDQGHILVDGWYDNVREFTSEEISTLSEVDPEDEMRQELGIHTFLGGLSGLELKKALYGLPTANIAGLWSGYTGQGHKTVLPSIAEAKMDFRLVPDQNPVQLVEKLKQHMILNGFEDVEAKLQAENPAARTSINSRIAQVAIRTGKDTFQSEPVILVSSAATGPMYWYTNVLGIPTVAIGCNHAQSNQHAPNENQRIDVFVEGAKWIARVLQEFGQHVN